VPRKLPEDDRQRHAMNNDALAFSKVGRGAWRGMGDSVRAANLAVRSI
jgi:hypothetical protein